LFSPEDMGRAAATLAVGNILSVAVFLRYEAAIVSATDEREAALLTIACLGLMIPVSCVGTAVLLGGIGTGAFSLSLSVPSALAAVPVALLVALTVLTRFWLLRRGGFGLIAKISLLQSSARAGVQLALGAVGAGSLGLVGGELAGRAVGLAPVAANLSAVCSTARPLQLRSILAVLRKHARFPILSLPSSLLDALSLNLSQLLIQCLYSQAEAGQFALAQLVVGLPLALVGGSAADGFHARLGAAARHDPATAPALFWQTARWLLPLGIAGGAFLAVSSGTLFTIVFGARWATAGLLVVAMAPAFVGQLTVSPLSRAVFVFQGQQIKLVYDVTRVCLTSGILLAVSRAGGSMVTAIALQSVCVLLSYGLYFILLLRVVRRGALSIGASHHLGAQRQ
jgi:O-antigen/teichoic acid export membrane protein